MSRLSPMLAFLLAFAPIAQPMAAGAEDGPRVAAIESMDALTEAPGRAQAPAAPAISDAAPAPKAALRGNPLWAIPARLLSATRERPLFSPSRRPPPPVVAAAPVAALSPPPPAPPAPSPPPEKPPVDLVGTILSEKDRIAIFVNPTSNLTTRVRQGDKESGWTLRTVEPRSAVLVKNTQSVTLALPKPGDVAKTALNAQGLPYRVQPMGQPPGGPRMPPPLGAPAQPGIAQNPPGQEPPAVDTPPDEDPPPDAGNL